MIRTVITFINKMFRIKHISHYNLINKSLDWKVYNHISKYVLACTYKLYYLIYNKLQHSLVILGELALN